MLIEGEYILRCTHCVDVSKHLSISQPIKAMKTTNSVSARDFGQIYEDRKCPLCRKLLGSDTSFFAHKKRGDPSACKRIHELIPFLKGVKKGWLAGKTAKELRTWVQDDEIVVNPLEDDDYEGVYRDHIPIVLILGWLFGVFVEHFLLFHRDLTSRV